MANALANGGLWGPRLHWGRGLRRGCGLGNIVGGRGGLGAGGWATPWGLSGSSLLPGPPSQAP